MTDIVAEISRAVDNLKPEMVEMCRSLVRINTVNPYAGAAPTGLEKDGQEFLKPILEDMGGVVRLFEPPPDIFERMGVLAPKGRSWKDRPNLVTEFDFGPGKRIILNSHMDTVGVADMEFDPFCGDVKNGRIYGRGAGDDKGGMVAGIIAIKALLKFADSLSGSIVHESVVDEECSGSGAGTLACCLEGYKGDEAIAIDGDCMTLWRGCMGVLTVDVKVKGRAGHAARGGVNAIEKAMIVKSGMDRFTNARQLGHPKCLVNLGIFNAGVHPAVVPGSAALSLNIVYDIAEAAANERNGGGSNGSAVRKEFERFIREAEKSDVWLSEHFSEVKWVKDLVPFETPEDAPLVRNLALAYEAVTGEKAAVGILAAWGDGSNIAGYGGAPTVHFGPGARGAAHSSDESVEIEDLVRCAKIIAVHLCRRLERK